MQFNEQGYILVSLATLSSIQGDMQDQKFFDDNIVSLSVCFIFIYYAVFQRTLSAQQLVVGVVEWEVQWFLKL